MDRRAQPTRRRSLRGTLLIIGGAIVAVVAVVVLALVGTSDHGRAKAASTPPTTDGNPDLGAANARSRQVTYVNTSVPVTFGGLQRHYIQSRPARRATGRKLPIIVFLHGRDETPAGELQRDNLASVISPSILVYPAGEGESWNAGHCCGTAQADNLNDVGFIEAVIARVRAANPDASPGRVYLAGYSNGGKMALLMACDDAAEFEAVAVFGATASEDCPGRMPSNLLQMAGSADTEVPDTAAVPPKDPDGFQPPSFATQIAEYRTVDGCSRRAVVTTVGSVTLRSWVGCASGDRVGEAVFAGQDHSWPEGSPTSPSGAGVIWAWFSALGA